jgi:hypothetical protein
MSNRRQIVTLELPIDQLEEIRIQWERDEEKRARYDARMGRSNHHGKDGNGKTKFKDYRFVGWDGEAPKDTGYSLFGSSDGHIVCHPHLGTRECFDLLLQAKREDPETIFVWFGGRYDWDEILRADIDSVHLSRLKFTGKTFWQGYKLEEVPGKYYTIYDGKTRVKIFEIHGWFHAPYAIALKRYQVGTPEEIERIISGKDGRPTFLWEEIEEIKEYWCLELKLMPLLMDYIRKICLDAGFNPRGWYGPSALAKELLTKNHIKKSMAKCPREVNEAACYAFAGGRFETFRGGVIKRRTRTYDKNSAYMHAALDLPNLARGEWRHTSGNWEPGRFALYHIRYRSTERLDVTKPYPLFRRYRNGEVGWPKAVEGWYWSPEAELVKDDLGAKFIEAWVFDEIDSSDRPFMFVKEIFRRRLVLQSLSESNPSRYAEAAFKWALAAIYGQLARVVGWDKKHRLPPATHQIEWAGYILSHCRADMHRQAVKCGSELLSIDTDSVTTLGSIDDLEFGRELGQWKMDEADEAVHFQTGIYFTCKDGKWSKGKTRGIEKRAKTPTLTHEMLIQAILEDKDVQLTPRRKYITIKMALNHQYEKMGDWEDHPGNILKFGGGGKRQHRKKSCEKLCKDGIHVFVPSPTALTYASRSEGTFDDVFDNWSLPRILPWQERKRTVRPPEDVNIDTLWVDYDDGENQEEWLVKLVEKKGTKYEPEEAEIRCDRVSPKLRTRARNARSSISRKKNAQHASMSKG